jgi:hypothetical protein
VIDIAQLLIATLRNDAAIQTLTGATAADSRVYAYYEPDANVNDWSAGDTQLEANRPAYLTMALLSRPNPGTGAVVSPVYSFAIWGRVKDTVASIYARVEALLHKQRLSTGTSRTIYSKIVNVNDSTQVQPNFVGITVHIRAGYFENP